MAVWYLHTASGYEHTFIIRNTAFPLQQWLHEYTSVLCYTYIAFLLINCM